MRLENRVALITGGAGGIGRATALRFAQEGAAVALTDVDLDGTVSVHNEIEKNGGRAMAFQANIINRAEVEEMIASILKKFGRLDILVNNAGITRDGLTLKVKEGQVSRLSEEQWDAVLDVNLKGTFLCAQAAALPMMEQKYGRIVNTASTSALGNIGQANYSASKAGVMGLTRTLALEWARFGITVNAIAPGAVKTRMTDAIPDALRAELVQRIPLRRMADPSEVANLHLFLASEEAGYITGQTIFIDGGLRVGA